MSLPGLIKIGYVNASWLADFSMPVIPADYLKSEPEWIELVGVGTLSEESSFLGVVTTVLEFSTPDDIPLNYPVGFVAVNAVGESLVIGNRQPHCGVLKKVAKIDKPDGEPSVNKYSFSCPIKYHKL